VARMPLREGDPSWIGRYRLTARLGSGGMGVVYLGVAGDGGHAAVKVLREELADDTEFRARFRREVSALTRVRGRYTVGVIEADTESRVPFIATEYADGPSLAEHVSTMGPLHPDVVYRLAVALAEALSVIHAAGVTHRDLKPANVLLTATGPKVIDFGIAQTMDGASITSTGIAIGSPGFMAPEQITGRAGQLADIFAWGLTVAFAASGQPPFGTGPTEAIMYRILHDAPDIAAVPGGLRPLVEAALVKDPDRRPGAQDVLRGLSARPVRDGDFHEATRTRLLSAGPGPAGVFGQPAGRRPQRRRLVAGLSAVAVAAVLAGTGAALAFSGGGGGGGAGTSTQPPATQPTVTQSAATQPASTPSAFPSHGADHHHHGGKKD
jgi:serine/threonine protein kinase